MKPAGPAPFRRSVQILVAALIAATGAGSAFADTNSAAFAHAKALSSPRSYAAAHQPSGKPTKASSFAPRPGGSHRHVYGAPIQSPILHHVQPPPKSPASPAPK
jgi:hypothetical protein